MQPGYLGAAGKVGTSGSQENGSTSAWARASVGRWLRTCCLLRAWEKAGWLWNTASWEVGVAERPGALGKTESEANRGKRSARTFVLV